jgi:hypothetical protein
MSRSKKPAFDMEEAIAALREGKDLTGRGCSEFCVSVVPITG